MINSIVKVIFVIIVTLALPAYAQNVIEDDGVGMTEEELSFLVERWTRDMQQAGANDPGDRLELLNLALVNKKIAAEFYNLTPEGDPDGYWTHVMQVRNMQRRYVMQRYIKTLDIPDMEDLALETYTTQKDRFASVPEKRLSSHILLVCMPAQCSRDERRPEAEKILAQLRGGANFEELAAEKSEDPGTKGKGGKFDTWLLPGAAHVDPHYVQGVFSIDSVGGYSDVIESQFGFHIIRLDEVEEAHFRSYEDVKDLIITTLQAEWVELAGKEYDSRFQLSDSATMDQEALDRIFAPYTESADSGEPGQAVESADSQASTR